MFRVKVFCALAVCVCAAAVAAQQQPAAPSDPRDRQRAARDLRDEGSSAIPRLEAMLSDPDRDVRVEAVKSIVEIDTQFSLDPLVRATRDNDPEVQIRATDGLVNFYLPGYAREGLSATLQRAGNAIKARFTDLPDVVIPVYIQVRPEVIEALGKLARGGASMDARANAARAVGVLRGQAAVPDLVEAIRSKDDRVIYESLLAIQKIRDPSAAPRISFLLRDLNPKIQIAAIETTGLLRNRDALPQLRGVLQNSKRRDVRRAALGAIAMLPDESSRELYSRYLNDKDEGLRAAAAEGFARLKNPADLPVMEKAFDGERKTSPRLSAAFALVSLGKTEISEFSPLQYLINNLNSSAWKGIARPFLVELAREDTVRRALEQAAARGTRDEKVEIAYVLSVSGDRNSVPVLESLTRDPDGEVSRAAITALQNLKSRL